MTTVTSPTPTFLNSFKTGDAVNVFFSGHDPITVAKQNSLYATIEEKLRTGDTSDLYELATFAARVKQHSGGKFILVEKDGRNVVLLHNKPMPPALSEFTLQFVEQGFDTDFIERFWKNLCQNPSEQSRESLYAFIEANNMTLTDDGCFIGYRSIRENWTDHATGRMDNSIGSTVSMDRSGVDSNPNNTCSTGLHVAAWSYASSFGYRASRLVEVKVNPRDVVTVPPDYNQQKMRVCEFVVLSEVTEERNSLVHPDTFVDASEAGDDWDTGSLVDSDTNATVVSNGSEVFVMNVTTSGGVNVPKELAKKAGFAVGDTANACYDRATDTVRISKACCNAGTACASRTVDNHNSIRLGSSVFGAWDLVQGDHVEGRVVTDFNGYEYIELS